MKQIPYSRQSVDPDDIKGVTKALKSDWLTQGPRVKEFEEALAGYTGAKYAVAVSSGTAALHLSMLTLGIKGGDSIITSPITFSASANCALYVGARPSFVDIDDSTYHMDTDKLEAYLKKPSNRKNVKAVVPVHLMGTVADVAAVKKACAKYGISVVEDAAHALGARYGLKGRSPRVKDRWVKVGSCRHSDVTIFSFHPIKHITTGEGGALLTNDGNIYKAAMNARHHGIVKSKKASWQYDIPSIGFNYRITDFQSALGISQLKKLDKMVSARRDLVSVYNRHLSKIGRIKLPHERQDTYASYHLYVIRVPQTGRNRLYAHLKKNGISTQVNYIPVHLLSYYKDTFGYGWNDFPVAERYYKECLSLPLYAGLTGPDQMKVIRTIERFFGA